MRAFIQEYIVGGDHHRSNPLLVNGRKSYFELAFATSIQHVQLATKHACCTLHVSQFRRGRRTVRIHEKGNCSHVWNNFHQSLKSRPFQLLVQETHPRHVRVRPVETRNETNRNRVTAAREHDRDDGGGRSFCCARCGVPKGSNDCYLVAQQIDCQLGQPTVLTICPAEFKRHIFAFDIASLSEALPKCGHEVDVRLW